MRTGTCDRCGDSFVDTSPAQQRRWCSENCRKRACAGRNRVSCVECGDPLSEGSGWRGRERCVPCANKTRSHREDIARWWKAGLSQPEIARLLGTTKNSVNVTIVHMRQEGWDMPYRYAMEDGKRVAA